MALIAWLAALLVKRGLSSNAAQLVAKGIFALICAITLAAVVAGAINMLSGAKRQAVVAKVDSAQGSAAMTSASDAVSAVNSRNAADQAVNEKVIYAQSAIAAAPDDAGADAAGRAGLCAVSPSLCPAGSVQQPHP